METQENMDFNRIAEAIGYIRQHYRQQPGLYEIAENVHLSESHFQRLFTEWAGTSPKKFLQYISIGHAKRILKENEKISLFDVAGQTGLSSASRLHDLFISLEGMTPAEYKNGGKGLSIRYNFFESPFGKLIVASTQKGICYMAFEEEEGKAVEDLNNRFPNAGIRQEKDILQQQAVSIFQIGQGELPRIKLHLKGTAFQLKVWEALLRIPMGRLTTYGAVAEHIGAPRASRAVGTAIGSNPIAFLIPCHRVIQSSGTFGGYMWGPTRKTAMIGWEKAQTERQ